MTPSSDQAAPEGASRSISLGSFSDPDGGPWTVTASWGDTDLQFVYHLNGGAARLDEPHLRRGG